MTTLLLLLLVLLDIGLLAAFMILNRRQGVHVELISELTEERQLLTELRSSVQEELDAAQSKAREALEKVTRIATEAEHEVKSGGETIAKEMEGVVQQLSTRFEQPLRVLSKKQSYLENLLKRIDKEKSVLKNLVSRGEKICKFFDERVPYEEVLSEISDKKYSDARSLLAKGERPGAVAQQLGMSESEVRIVAGLSR